MRVLNCLLGREKYLSKGTEGDHNILIKKKCTCQDTQQNSFQTQAPEDIICPILDLALVEMNIIQKKVFVSCS